jgi:serine/threonine protein kinase
MFDKQGMMLGQRYEMQSFIGKGGMSQVWKARHIHLEKNVAVKLLSKNLLDKEAFVARFKQEAQIASHLNHPNICGVTDFGFSEDNVPYLVMEFLEGESLSDILRRIERLPVGAALSIIKQTLSGLQAAHRIGVVHRDIKPGNLFITKEKAGGRVLKILDFGISKMVAGSNRKDLGLTSTGTLLGTAFYLSPEQIMESKGVDHKTDIYAVGAVLYKLITGRVPYLGENYAEVAVKVVNDPLVDPRKLVAGLNTSVARIIRKAMEKDTRSRYQSVDQMLADVDKVLEDFQGDTIDALYKPGLESMILQPIEQKPPLLSRKVQIAAISLSAAVIIGVGLVMAALYFNPFAGKTDSKAEQGQAAVLLDKETEPENKQQEEAQEPNPGGELTGQVTVRFNSVPDNVQIKVGDEVFEGNAVSIDKSTDPVKITLQAEGYMDRKVTIVPLANLELSGKLEPLPVTTEMEVASAAKKTGKHKGKKGGKPKTDTGTKTQPAAEDTKKTSKGMDFIRDYPGKK